MLKRTSVDHSNPPRRQRLTEVLLLVALMMLLLPHRAAYGAELHRNMNQQDRSPQQSVSENTGHSINQQQQPTTITTATVAGKQQAMQQQQPISPMPHSHHQTRATMANRNQHNQRRQQRQEDELNVMGQKVMVAGSAGTSSNASSNRLDQAVGGRSNGHNHHHHQREPQRQHIDPAASKHPTLAAGSERQFNGTQMGGRSDQQQHQHQPESEFNVGASDPSAARQSHHDTLVAAAAAAAAAQTGQRELHFGAKVALSILASVILLVASATFVDLNSSATRSPPVACGANSVLHQHQHQKHQHHLVHLHSSHQRNKNRDQLSTASSSSGQRDQRSPSLSSSSSSTLFSSANSLSSASAPILSRCNNHTSAHQRQPHSTAAATHEAQHSAAGNGNNSSSSNSSWLQRVGGQVADTCGRARKHQYCHNLQLNLGLAQPEQQARLQTGSQKQEASLMAAVLKVTGGGASRCWLAATAGADLAPATSGAQPNNDHQHQHQHAVHKPQVVGSADRRRHLARQVFLSFSLRHSASLIFERDRPAEERKQPQLSPLLARRGNNSSTMRTQLHQCGACGAHRSRLSSLSSVNEAASESSGGNQSDLDDASSSGDMVCDLDTCSCCCSSTTTFQQQQDLATSCDQSQSATSEPHRYSTTTSNRSESIDSLHGLRFLSMIWIIVIHSYGFALRWLFFTNSPTLDNIYKTAASQLLANGTFACDSFFFAGGFLLPYLAFPAYHPPSPKERNTQPLQATTSQQQQQQYCSSQPFGAPRSPSLAASPTESRLEHEQLCKQDRPSRSTCSSSPEIQEKQQQQQDSCLSSNGIYCDSRQSHITSSGFRQLTTGPLKPSASQAAATGAPATAGWQQQQHASLNTNEFTMKKVIANILHRYIRMMPLMMAIIGLSASLLRYMGEGPTWDDSTLMFDKWCRKNWWINAIFLHNFLNRENMCLGHSWYSAVDIQLFLLGQLIMFILFRSRRFGLMLCCAFLIGAQLITGALTLLHHLPAVPLIASVSEQSMNLYYGEIYIKPYCRASPYLIGMLLAYLMRTTSLGQVRLCKWQVATGWTASIGTLAAILMAMQPAMNGQVPSELQSALYSSLSRPLWACATGWMIFACMTGHGGVFATILGARCFVPLSRLTYPAFLIHPIVMAVFYGSRQSSFQFSHYLMLYLILGNIVITYALAFLLSALFELPLLSVERAIKRACSPQSNHLPSTNRPTKDHHHHHQETNRNWTPTN